MSKLRDIWDDIVSRLENDEAFNRFFSEFDTSIQAKEIINDYCRISIGQIGPSEFGAISGNPPFMAMEITINVLIIVSSDDLNRVTDQFLKGAEIFYNALFNKNVVFDNKIQNVPVITFDAIQPVSNDNGFKIEANGTITFNLQKFLGGSL